MTMISEQKEVQCEFCKKQIWREDRCRCKGCGKIVCPDCRKFYLHWNKEKYRINGREYSRSDLVMCKECGKEWECEYCKQFKTKEELESHFKQLQKKLHRMNLPKPVFYSACVICERFVCEVHSVEIEGIIHKYKPITLCRECLEKQKCIKCGAQIQQIQWQSAVHNKAGQLICYKCHRGQQKKKFATLMDNQERHCDLQGQLKAFFEQGLGLSVLWERQLDQQFKVDIVAVNKCRNLIYGFEIKTGKISKEIGSQLAHYVEHFDFFYVILLENEVESLIKKVDGRYGIFIVNTDQTMLTLVRQAQGNQLTKAQILKSIKPYGLRWITIIHRLRIKPTELRQMSVKQLVTLISRKVDETTLKLIYCQYILKEQYVDFFTMTNAQYYRAFPEFQPKVVQSQKLDKFFDK